MSFARRTPAWRCRTKMQALARNVPNKSGDVIRSVMWRDAIVRHAATAAKRAAPTDKAYARAMGVSQPTANRRRNFDPYSPETRALETFDRLAAGDRTTAFPLLIEAWAVVDEREIETATDAQLAAWRYQLELDQFDVARDVRQAQYTGNDDELIEAHARAGACHVRLMAIVRQQKKRKGRVQ